MVTPRCERHEATPAIDEVLGGRSAVWGFVAGTGRKQGRMPRKATAKSAVIRRNRRGILLGRSAARRTRPRN